MWGLSERVRVLRFATVALMIAPPVALHLLRLDMRLGMVSLVLVAAGYLWAERMLVRQAWGDYHVALEAGDTGRARGVLEQLQPFAAGTSTMRQIELARAGLDLMDERWAQARQGFEALLEDPSLQWYRLVMENNLAWALMHLGIPQRSLDLSRAASAAAERSGHSALGACRGTHAVGLVLAGQAADGVIELERVLKEHAGDGPRMQAIRAYYLGEGYAALGKIEEAREAWQRAAKEAPATAWAGKARARLTAAEGTG